MADQVEFDAARGARVKRSSARTRSRVLCWPPELSQPLVCLTQRDQSLSKGFSLGTAAPLQSSDQRVRRVEHYGSGIVQLRVLVVRVEDARHCA